jgi:hypothetical protein
MMPGALLLLWAVLCFVAWSVIRVGTRRPPSR